jgi:hypothetical protein
MDSAAGSTEGLLGQARAAAHSHGNSGHATPAQAQGGLLDRSRAAGPGEQEQAGIWMDFIMKARQKGQSSTGNQDGGNAGTNQDGYEQARGRSLPDEQEEQEKTRGR